MYDSKTMVQIKHLLMISNDFSTCQVTLVKVHDWFWLRFNQRSEYPEHI